MGRCCRRLVRRYGHPPVDLAASRARPGDPEGARPRAAARRARRSRQSRSDVLAARSTVNLPPVMPSTAAERAKLIAALAAALVRRLGAVAALALAAAIDE